MADFVPTHPGEILAKEFLAPLGITPYRLAKEIGVPQPRLSEIIRGRRSITVDTGLRLSRALGLSDMFWINLQARYDADLVRTEKSEELGRIHTLVARGRAVSTPNARNAAHVVERSQPAPFGLA